MYLVQVQITDFFYSQKRRPKEFQDIINSKINGRERGIKGIIYTFNTNSGKSIITDILLHSIYQFKKLKGQDASVNNSLEGKERA